MKCFYYLTDTLTSTEAITEALRQAGMGDGFIHVLSKDPAGLTRRGIHSSNWLEQLDLLRHGLIGAGAGLLIGLLSVVLLRRLQVFGAELPGAAYWGLIVFWTLFGAWEGGLIGIATENKKLALFHDDLAAGRYLLLIYTRRNHESLLKTVMREQHPEAEQVAIDARFYNPLAGLRRQPIQLKLWEQK